MAEPKPLQLAQAKALHALNHGFCIELPDDMRQSGRYEVQAGDRFARQRVPVPDGKYRLAGSDYVFAIAGGRLTQAVRADPPDFGGDDVIAVEYDAAGVTTSTKGA